MFGSGTPSRVGPSTETVARTTSTAHGRSGGRSTTSPLARPGRSRSPTGRRRHLVSSLVMAGEGRWVTAHLSTATQYKKSNMCIV